ncbi:DUF2934 domain-containing protein [Chelativorans alearense]|uniref:DUF2934 domain-containing protein n=1 Tax=Chelativorans alearense TaxID=2681495 RepID=UPI0013D1F85A|nr:DUF2934 domain-containing protein [Chelativorans alearense]
MSSDREEQVRRRAYELWEMEGRPEGRHREHWERAAREMAMEKDGSAEDAEIPEEMPQDFPQARGRSEAAGGRQPGGSKRGARAAATKGNTGADDKKRRSTGTAKRPKKSP